MQYVKKWKKYIASLLAFAMLISNFTPSLQTIYAQSNDEEISSIELQQDEQAKRLKYIGSNLSLLSGIVIQP